MIYCSHELYFDDLFCSGGQMKHLFQQYLKFYSHSTRVFTVLTLCSSFVAKREGGYTGKRFLQFTFPPK